jgi:hypothetical protein
MESGIDSSNSTELPAISRTFNGVKRDIAFCKSWPVIFDFIVCPDNLQEPKYYRQQQK